MTRASLLLIALSTVVTGCGNKEGGAAPTSVTKLPVVDMLLGEGVGAMQVEAIRAPQTLDEAKSDARRGT